MFNFLFVVMTMLPVQDNGCYIVCEAVDTIGWEERAFQEIAPCPRGVDKNGISCAVLHYQTVMRWEPILQFTETFRIPISCDDAAIIDENRLRVIR